MDIGLDDWVFEVTQSAGADIAPCLLGLVDDPIAVRLKVEATMDFCPGNSTDKPPRASQRALNLARGASRGQNEGQLAEREVGPRKPPPSTPPILT
jgi:hypothetical protein